MTLPKHSLGPELPVLALSASSDPSSDLGSQFTLELWNAIACSLGMKLHRTAAHHPQANGLCERFHHSMKASLRASLKGSGWVDPTSFSITFFFLLLCLLL